MQSCSSSISYPVIFVASSQYNFVLLRACQMDGLHCSLKAVGMVARGMRVRISASPISTAATAPCDLTFRAGVFRPKKIYYNNINNNNNNNNNNFARSHFGSSL